MGVTGLLDFHFALGFFLSIFYTSIAIAHINVGAVFAISLAKAASIKKKGSLNQHLSCVN